ncbi:MAG: hypothetical protein COB10_12125 [Planctomycetota bacterium]|nr:MAG: hypothetical protein COB10_12125 [Planctomycetota bacterium]
MIEHSQSVAADLPRTFFCCDLRSDDATECDRKVGPNQRLKSAQGSHLDGGIWILCGAAQQRHHSWIFDQAQCIGGRFPPRDPLSPQRLAEKHERTVGVTLEHQHGDLTPQQRIRVVEDRHETRK